MDAFAGTGLHPGELTLGDCIVVAEVAGTSVSDVVMTEAMLVNGLSRHEVEAAVMNSFSHNLMALDAGLQDGESFLFGRVAHELSAGDTPPVMEDRLINKMIIYTLAAQVGNHCVGLEPCAGTGDSCPYVGFIKAVREEIDDQERIVAAAAVMLKAGTIFRVAKTSTGCNLEGFGAGAAAIAAAFIELAGGSPAQLGKAVVLALSPTIATPCTPRVMVPGLCATHIGGAILVGKLASHLAMYTNIPVNVPVDVMIAMAAAVHLVSAKQVVPVVIQYMEPFFRVNPAVESYIGEDIKADDTRRQTDIQQAAIRQARELARQAKSIINPFGVAVVGGSSQAVGSPTNAGRLAHHLARGRIKKIKIELYPELFARRGITVPGILMGAAYGASTADGLMYKTVMDRIKADGIEVEILQAEEHQAQKVTIEAGERHALVDARNRGGGRLALVRVEPDKDEAIRLARELQIDIVA
ncbi:MAG: serine dehydratase [Deltaproteobacteria bacterium]|nr:serine dehydratase [Deltaproteobacteria bacterium]